VGTASPSNPFQVGTSDLIVDSSGNVGIGTSLPTSELTIGSDTPQIDLYKTSSADVLANIRAETDAGSGGKLVFQTKRNGDSALDRMTIDDDGNLLVAASSVPSSSVAGCRFNDPNAAAPTISRGSGTTEISMLTFQNGNGTVGQITTNGSATAYLTSSDYRLKEDVQPMTGASDRVLALNPVNFAWKVDGSRVDGFLAHQAQAVVPEAVTGTHNEVDADGNAVMQGIDQSKLVPLLTAALKEAITKIETLETEMTSVKARLDALEAN